MIDKLVHAAVDTIPGVEGGGISRTEQGTVRSSHATAGDFHELDELQSRLEEGPCITAADDPPPSGIVLAQDLAGDDAHRWPRFAPAAVERGFRSIMSVGLSVAGTRRSALNLYAGAPGVFDASAQLTAGLFGLQAAMLLHGADHAARLGHALETRDLIGQAKGILMERFTVDDDEAFRLLVTSSQDTNMKLVDVARWLTKEANARAGASSGPASQTV
ncbi:ANTAR domain-containing protein [Actinomycetospora sp. TBRC 11914]|nr:ANTAR domain-containing protein [Actinomycetospora sp. TBRC 11914]